MLPAKIDENIFLIVIFLIIYYPFLFSLLQHLENFGGIMESIQDINTTNQAHHLVAGLTTDQTSPGDEDELTKTNSKTGVVLVHQKQTPHPAVTENLEEPGIDHQPQLEEDPQSVNVNRYQLCGEEAFVIQPEPAVTSEENAPEKAPTPLKAHDIPSSSRETLHVDKMLTEVSNFPSITL